MKKFLLTLAVMAFASSAMMAQTTVNSANEKAKLTMQNKAVAPKHECKDHQDGKPCTKPADQQCDDCKTKAAEAQKHECKKGEAMKHDCKKGEGQKCEKAEGMKHECNKGEGHKCEKAEGMKHDCEKGEGHKCEKAEGMKHDCKKGEAKKREKAEGMKHDCKDHKDGKPCTKPADQQCDDCKAKAPKKD